MVVARMQESSDKVKCKANLSKAKKINGHVSQAKRLTKPANQSVQMRKRGKIKAKTLSSESSSSLVFF